MKIISLGLGVQSTALYYMSSTGEMPRVDHAIFVDTGREKKKTLIYLKYLQRWQKENNGVPIIVIRKKNLYKDLLNYTNSRGNRFSSIPAFTKNEDGSIGMLRRQCTGEYKIEQVDKAIREILNIKQILTRKIGVERVAIYGKQFEIVCNDNVVECDLAMNNPAHKSKLKPNSVGLILTSIPFGNQYEYSPNYADFGHSDDKYQFWNQMDYLTDNLLRCLMPGRLMCIHVKDRITPSGLTGRGYQTVDHFHVDAIEHYTTCPKCRIRIAISRARGRKPHPCRHRFGYMGMKTIVTDVVRENNQTYRLGWTEQCKDGSKMGVGMPEYLLIFRKDPTDTSNAYSDIPVEKSKPLQRKKDGSTQKYRKEDYNLPIILGSGYSRSRWQIDAHGFTRSSGDRLMDPKELAEMDHSAIFQNFKEHSLHSIYDFEQHVKIAEDLEVMGKLPSGFMLLQPQSWTDEVWTDITRMLTLNGTQWSMGKEMHICPMQFDIADRVIEQMSNPGDVVYDPFGGLMTTPLRAILKGRYGIAHELNPQYFLDGATHLKAAEYKISVPTLFDFVNEQINIPA